MKWLALALRILVGLPMFAFGMMYFLNMMPPPPENLPESAKQMMGVFGPTGWLTIIKTLEVVGGLLLLVGRFVPLGLVLLVPVTVNIAIWDAVIMKYNGLPLGTILLVLEIVLIWLYRQYFKPLFTAKAVVAE
jgi:putative oxidoreductase